MIKYKYQTNERLRILWDAYVTTKEEVAWDLLKQEAYQFCFNFVLAKQRKYKLTNEKLEDVTADLVLVIYEFFQSTSYVPRNPKLTYSYLHHVCRNHFDRLVYSKNVDRQIFETSQRGFYVDGIFGHYGCCAKSVLSKILQELSVDLLEYFLVNCRFEGDDGKACLYLFKQILNSKPYDLMKLSYSRNIPLNKIRFFEIYVLTILKASVYNYRESYKESVWFDNLLGGLYPQAEIESTVGQDFFLDTSED